MNNETTRHKAMGLANDDPPPHDSANRAQQPCALKKIPTGTVPDHTIVEYLPTCGVHWEFVTACHKAHKQRPYCYSTDLFHWKIGCPYLAALGEIAITDSTKSKALITKYKEHTARRNVSKAA